MTCEMEKMIGRAEFEKGFSQIADLKRGILDVCQAKQIPVANIISSMFHVSVDFSLKATDKVQALNELKTYAYAVNADIQSLGYITEFYLLDEHHT